MSDGGIDLSDKALNGRRAEALLNDPFLNAIFDAVANGYRLAWENAARGDIAQQQAAHYSLACLKDVIGTIRAHLSSAKLYEADLEQKRQALAAKNYPRY